MALEERMKGLYATHRRGELVLSIGKNEIVDVESLSTLADGDGYRYRDARLSR